VRITQEISWKGIKDETVASFPGDHATTLLLFGLLYSAAVPRRLSITAWLYILLRTLPRLVVGAHWFSDIAIGSLSIALFFSSCFLHTPVGPFLIDLVEKIRKIASLQRQKE
jgi:membrane-associated phospholipid phosphatase